MPVMAYIFMAVIGAGVAGAVVWLWAKAHYGAEVLKRSAEGGLRAASAEALVSEFKEQALKKDAEANRLRAELDLEKKGRVQAETKLNEAEKNFEEQKSLIEAMRAEMTDTFNALSSAALKSSSADFLQLASERLNAIMAETKGKLGLGEHKSSMDSMIKPLEDTLKRYEEHIKEIEKSRHQAYGSLTEQIKAVALSNENLQKETGNLVAALRKPQVRGRWGEMQLRRVAELSGMSAHCDFTEQVSVESDAGRQRPDMIVHLPGNVEIIVDSKVSLEAYLDAASAQTEDEKKRKTEAHARQVRSHMSKLSSKEYQTQFKRTPEMVILFMPGEPFLSAALEADTALLEDGMKKKVLFATPATLIALMHAIAFGWRQVTAAENAEKISQLGRELYERFVIFLGHFDKLGKDIKGVNESYNKLVGSAESRVLPQVRKFKELGATGSAEIPALEQVEVIPRALEINEKV
ncbi:DNA recombination protein RmuC [bacterium]|nr:MAG: DNA recombination protein RmuC [bacterium]